MNKLYLLSPFKLSRWYEKCQYIRQYISKNSVSRWWISCICFPRFSSLVDIRNDPDYFYGDPDPLTPTSDQDRTSPY